MLRVEWRHLLQFLDDGSYWREAGHERPTSTLTIELASSGQKAGPLRTETRVTAEKMVVLDFDAKERVSNIEFV